jgi:outer membrane protein assembly factor BamA
MRRSRWFLLVTFVFLAASLRADCVRGQDHRSSKNSGVLISDFTINGTQALGSDELAAIESEITGSCFDESSDEIEERVRALFQNRGYFGVVLNSLRIQPNDPVAVPKTVTVEADVLEGPRYRLAEIGFVGNHAFDADELRNKFPFKKGDLFARDKIASGLGALRDLYVSSGFIDFTLIPDTQILSNATVILSVSVMEGQQYHMGKLEIFARKEITDRLRAEWHMTEGAVFDMTYLEKYIGSNRSLLPPEFQRQHMQLVRDCQDAIVDVRLPLDATDPRSQSVPKELGCDAAKGGQLE